MTTTNDHNAACPLALELDCLPYLQKPVVLGLSGGRDSVALLRLLVQQGCSVHALHVHHGIRAAEAEAEALKMKGASENEVKEKLGEILKTHPELLKEVLAKNFPKVYGGNNIINLETVCREQICQLRKHLFALHLNACCEVGRWDTLHKEHLVCITIDDATANTFALLEVDCSGRVERIDVEREASIW